MRPKIGQMAAVAGRLALIGALCLGESLAAHAQTTLSQVRLIADPSVGGQAAPIAQTFTVKQANSFAITLTDLQIPAPLATLSVAVVSPGATALQLSINGTSHSASQSVTLQPGTYTVQVLATATTNLVGGTFSVQVTNSGGTAVALTPVSGGSPAYAFVGTVGAPASAIAGQSLSQKQFIVTDAGSYQLTFTDLAFPQAAFGPGAFAVALWNEDAPTPLLLNGSYGPGTVPIMLAKGTYELVVLAQASGPALGGLYSITLTGGSSGSSTPYAATAAVGYLPAPVEFSIPSAGTLSVTLSDLAIPAPLVPGSLQGLLVEGATPLQLGTPVGNTYSVQNVHAGTAQLYLTAQPDSAAGEGSYAAVVTGAGSGGSSQTLLDNAQVITNSGHYGYVFSTTVGAATADSYQLEINDYQLPAALSALSVAAEQGGALLATTTLGTETETLSQAPQAGTINIVAFAAPTSSAGALFGLQLSDVTSGATAYQTTQGVGSAFSQQSVTVSSPGTYDLSLADLGVPANFGQLDLIVTSGRQMVGEIDGSNSLSFSATAGTYYLNILAHTGTLTGGSAANYGMYGLQMNAAQSSTTGSTTSSSGGNHGGGGGGAFSPVDLVALTGLLLLRRRKSAHKG